MCVYIYIYNKNLKEFSLDVCMHATTYIINNYILMNSIRTIYQQHNVYTVISIVTITFPTLVNLIHA